MSNRSKIIIISAVALGIFFGISIRSLVSGDAIDWRHLGFNMVMVSVGMYLLIKFSSKKAQEEKNEKKQKKGAKKRRKS